MSEVTEQEQAAAYIKLQDDVKQLIMDTVMMELTNPSSQMFSYVSYLIDKKIREEFQMHMQNQIQNYRIVQRGTTAPW